MKLTYQIYEFHLAFDSPAFFDVYPAFVFRSVLGMRLRRVACIFGDRRCDECSLRTVCSYSFIFETPVNKDNDAVAGRDRAGHPFALFCHEPYRKKVESCDLRVSLFGKAIDYFPYVFHAFAQAGEGGILRPRNKYLIKDVQVAGRSIVVARDHATGSATEIEMKVPSVVWVYGEARQVDGKLTVRLRSPLRLKINGRYSKDFSAKDFFDRLRARARMLAVLYGESDEGDDSYEDGDHAKDGDHDKDDEHAVDTEATARSGGASKITERELDWLDLPHYSSRQGGGMKMGGAVGGFTLSGGLDRRAVSLLDFGRIFHGGKNPSFGLGAMETVNG